MNRRIFTPRCGEIWTSNDPRRLYGFRILSLGTTHVAVENVVTGTTSAIRRDRFTTGTAGYSRFA